MTEAGTIVAGHGRILGARKLGIKEVPVMVAQGWTEAQVRAYALADNKLALNAGWDPELLALEIADLQKLEFDVELTGFSSDEILALCSKQNEGLTDPDEAPEPPVNPVSKPGDLWLLGEHRLLCGDSTSQTDVACRHASSSTIHLLSDPPVESPGRTRTTR